MCRRYLADEEDFSEANLIKNGIEKRYQNIDINVCLFQIKGDIKNITINSNHNVV
jgi:guanylate kinase